MTRCEGKENMGTGDGGGFLCLGLLNVQYYASNFYFNKLNTHRYSCNHYTKPYPGVQKKITHPLASLTHFRTYTSSD
jgi:hypothetical protein